MKVKSLYIIALAAAILSAGCGGSKKHDPKPPPAVTAATLLVPANNELCSAGQSLTETTSLVSFSWSNVSNAAGYTISVKNLLNGQVSSKKVSGNTTADTLLKSTPYSWTVITHGSGTMADATSDAWRFYNSGPAIINYVPFPADLTAPTQGQKLYAKTTISLTWTGSSIQNNITGYDIYFGTTINPPLYKSDYNGTSLDNVSISANTTYYWKVVTKDSNGNTSDSELFQFSNF